MYYGEICFTERQTGETGKLFLRVHKHKSELEEILTTFKSRPWSPPYTPQKYLLLRKTIKCVLNLRSRLQSCKWRSGGKKLYSVKQEWLGNIQMFLLQEELISEK